MNRRSILLAVAALAAAAAGGWLASRPPAPGDEALILALFDDAARAAEARRPADAVAGVSEDFRGQGLTRRELERLVAVNALRRAWVAVKVAGAQVAVDGEVATARVMLVLSRGGAGTALADLLPSQASAWSVEARLRREGGRWQVVSAGWAQVPLAEALGAPAPR
jgi:hypothetical protein